MVSITVQYYYRNHTRIYPSYEKQYSVAVKIWVYSLNFSVKQNASTSYLFVEHFAKRECSFWNLEKNRDTRLRKVFF